MDSEVEFNIVRDKYSIYLFEIFGDSLTNLRHYKTVSIFQS